MNSGQAAQNVLVINCGSSSLKYQLLDMSKEGLLAKGLVERIGLDQAVHTYQRPDAQDLVTEQSIADHAVAIELVLKALADPDIGVVGSMDEVSAVGHRVVHAGEKFSGSVMIDDAVLDDLRRNEGGARGRKPRIPLEQDGLPEVEVVERDVIQGLLPAGHPVAPDEVGARKRVLVLHE